jgi:branched-chain amino acid transport system permease protein
MTTALQSGVNKTEDLGRGEKQRRPVWRRPIVTHAVVLVAFLLAPFILQEYLLDVLTLGVVYGLMAMSLALVVGQVGLPSLGHAAFVGLGGYAAGLLAIHVTANPLVGLTVAVMAGALGAALLGLISLWTHGIFFLMLSLAFAEIIHEVAQQSSSYAGGANGLSGVPTVMLGPLELTKTPFIAQFYWYAVIIAALAFVVLTIAQRSPLGKSMAGTRDNAARMRAIGYSVTGIRMRAVIISGAVCAVGGGLLLQKESFVSPSSVTPDVSVLLLVMVLIGGSQSLLGPFLAGVGLMILRSLASNWVGDYWQFMLGAVFVLTVYLLPGGLPRIAQTISRRFMRRNP